MPVQKETWHSLGCYRLKMKLKKLTGMTINPFNKSRDFSKVGYACKKIKYGKFLYGLKPALFLFDTY